MASTTDSQGISSDGLRERLPQRPDAPQQAKDTESASDAVKALNAQAVTSNEGKDEKDKKTYGRTPDGIGAYQQPPVAAPGSRALYGKYTVATRASIRQRLSISTVPFLLTNIADAV